MVLAAVVPLFVLLLLPVAFDISWQGGKAQWRFGHAVGIVAVVVCLLLVSLDCEPQLTLAVAVCRSLALPSLHPEFQN